MKTPICDFVKEYTEKNGARLHMPGHKGRGLLGFEAYDLTEITGADSLYEADGIIAESEKNASELFGSRETFYSTEGSSQCIRAMVALVTQGNRERPLIVAARNAHKTFIYAAALMDADILWVDEKNENFTLCRSEITPQMLEDTLKNAPRVPSAVYLTSPDYLGGELDIKGLAEISHSYGVPLLVDNAHGAYLKFLEGSRHPLDLGADVCCDSAHKTLPVLTGGAYLHISKNALSDYEGRARSALALFGSTSPSYLILESLDSANKYLSDRYAEKLYASVKKLDLLKEKLKKIGYTVEKSDPLKLTVKISDYGYNGTDFSRFLNEYNISIEYFDPDFAVMMFTPENTEPDYQMLYSAMSELPRKDAIKSQTLELGSIERKLSPREALFSNRETVTVDNSVGRILAEPNVSCPPAVSPISCGEKITMEAVDVFKYYGITAISVVSENK